MVVLLPVHEDQALSVGRDPQPRSYDIITDGGLHTAVPVPHTQVGEITMSLEYVEGEMSTTSKGTMCDGKSYQDGDHEVWGSLPMFAIDEYICLVIWRTQVEAL